MPIAIHRDLNRFKDIVQGKVRRNLKQYISHGELTGKKGKDIVSIPVPNIEIPRFKHGRHGSGGVGSGDGEIGKTIGRGGEGDGEGKAGSEPGRHLKEVELTHTELAKWLQEELTLPDLEPKGKNTIVTQTFRRMLPVHNPGHPVHRRRTYMKMLRRSIASGIPMEERVIEKGDIVRQYPDITMKPQSSAAIIFIMDVSGSMRNEQKELARRVAFFSKVWVMNRFPGTELRFIVHDSVAKECDEETFFTTKESGGTRISPAYKLASEIIDKNFSGDQWNIYAVHFSDGDNWGEDNKESLDILKTALLPKCNMFGYVQTESPYGSGDFLHEIQSLDNAENLRIARLETGRIGSDDPSHEILSTTGTLRAIWGAKQALALTAKATVKT